MRTNTAFRIAALALAASASACASNAPSARFEATNDVVITVPQGARETRAWIALPADDDPAQRIEHLDVQVDAPAGVDVRQREIRDGEGNRFLYLEAPGAGGQTLKVNTRFTVERREVRAVVDPDKSRPLTPDEIKRFGPDLGASAHLEITPEMQTLAKRIVGDEKNPVRQARLLYDWVLGDVSYWVKHPDRLKASGVGSSTYTLEQQCGNCTDFHSLYTALARSVDLPTRMVYGSLFKGPLDGQDKDQSYHCWIEFWAPEIGWIPLDVALADIFVDDFQVDDANRSGVELTVADGYHGPDAGLVDYYFGNLDDRRVSWHRGRDLRPDPAPANGPINALPKAFVEVDGKVLAEKEGWTRLLTFHQTR